MLRYLPHLAPCLLRPEYRDVGSGVFFAPLSVVLLLAVMHVLESRMLNLKKIFYYYIIYSPWGLRLKPTTVLVLRQVHISILPVGFGLFACARVCLLSAWMSSQLIAYLPPPITHRSAKGAYLCSVRGSCCTHAYFGLI
ncbi:hypothetical protein GGR51DRAFT_527763 [Nemania sp. FL0031]|nr:hypothetical protein GGR51DRAFT_527763 [Nemania sp. FL0031]